MDSEKVNLSEAKAHLGRYVAEASAGKVFIVCERNEPVAELRPLSTLDAPGAARPIKLGLLEGQFKVPDDFTAPLPNFEADFYGDHKREPW